MKDINLVRRGILEELVNSVDQLRMQHASKEDEDYEYRKAFKELAKLDAQMNKDKVVMDVDEIADIIPYRNIVDMNSKGIRKGIAKSIIDHFTPPEGKGISEEKVLDIVIKTIATGEKYTKEELVYRLKKVVKEIVKAEREGRL